MCLPFGTLFREIWYSDGGGSSETKEPELHKLGVFGANYCKKHPIWSKSDAFLSKMVYWWAGNWPKIGIEKVKFFEVRQAHPRTILVYPLSPRTTYSFFVQANNLLWIEWFGSLSCDWTCDQSEAWQSLEFPEAKPGAQWRSQGPPGWATRPPGGPKWGRK